MEGNILTIDTSVYKDIKEVSSFAVGVSSSLDVPLWRLSGVLWHDANRLISQAWCEAFVPVERKRFHDGFLFLVLLGCLHWILHPLHGSILPKVFVCWIYLVRSTLVWQ